MLAENPFGFPGSFSIEFFHFSRESFFERIRGWRHNTILIFVREERFLRLQLPERLKAAVPDFGRREFSERPPMRFSIFEALQPRLLRYILPENRIKTHLSGNTPGTLKKRYFLGILIIHRRVQGLHFDSFSHCSLHPHHSL